MGNAIVLILAATLAGACGSSERRAHGGPSPIDGPPPIDAVPDAVPSCVTDVDPLTEAPLRERLTYLASPALAGRESGSPGEALARTHVAARFRCLGLVPAGDDGDYIQAFEENGRSSGNVIGYLPGTDPIVGTEIVVVGAHMDHVGTDGEHTWFGANDNASGTTAMLAVAQAFAQRRAGPRRTVAFVGFGAEETGLNGSRHLVENMPAALPIDRVVYMINLDMVGTYDAKRRVLAMGSFPGLRGRELLDSLLPAYPDLTVKRGGSSTRSDHAPFCAAGIPYLFFFTADPPCYHRTCDTADRIDYRDLARIASLAAELAHRLADDDTDLLAARARTGCGKKK